ncbi:MAG: YbaB/EbfC family nucleoid-associated protein [Nocardia sp.]|uniref:YbaB/EbfC family nucleoid-associated protein n=1 Tax=Nocardia sp. TaxID=1821 RepID=UPI0026111AD6|nr:YbaB/EbfC family nucleoid-associated protein [Nocardia sp.]MCU1640795.1 YbaB/EbfC family nucleoid-associated protein [Nocardia sp.]
MEQPSLDHLQAANDEMKRLVDTLLDGLDQRAADLPGICDRLATSRSSAWSADRRVEVTVDAYGIVLDVRLADNAFEGGRPERLARSIKEAAVAAARAAHRRRDEILAPITETTAVLPDLTDLFPGMPRLPDIRRIVQAATRTRSDTAADTACSPAQDEPGQ